MLLSLMTLYTSAYSVASLSVAALSNSSRVRSGQKGEKRSAEVTVRQLSDSEQQVSR